MKILQHHGLALQMPHSEKTDPQDGPNPGLAALPGLALVGTVPSLCALVELACSDGTSAVRLQALQQMEVLQDREWPREVLVGREVEDGF